MFSLCTDIMSMPAHMLMYECPNSQGNSISFTLPSHGSLSQVTYRYQVHPITAELRLLDLFTLSCSTQEIPLSDLELSGQSQWHMSHETSLFTDKVHLLTRSELPPQVCSPKEECRKNSAFKQIHSLNSLFCSFHTTGLCISKLRSTTLAV